MSVTYDHISYPSLKSFTINDSSLNNPDISIQLDIPNNQKSTHIFHSLGLFNNLLSVVAMLAEVRCDKELIQQNIYKHQHQTLFDEYSTFRLLI